MSARLVVDSSALVALLVDTGDVGEWVTESLVGAEVAVPELALFEAANILRRQQARGVLEPLEATLAHADLLSLPLRTWPYLPLSDRAWQLRGSLTVYDASYVALAELLSAPLLTLDERLAGAKGPRCAVLTP